MEELASQVWEKKNLFSPKNEKRLQETLMDDNVAVFLVESTNVE